MYGSPVILTGIKIITLRQEGNTKRMNESEIVKRLIHDEREEEKPESLKYQIDGLQDVRYLKIQSQLGIEMSGKAF